MQVLTGKLELVSDQMDTRLSKLETRLDHYEQNDERSSLVVQNLWKEKDEQVEQPVYNLRYEVLDVDMARANISFSYWKEAPHESSLAYPRPILVRISSMDIKSSVTKAR